jgi:hypothetical protein
MRTETTQHLQVDDLPITRVILHDCRIQQLDNVMVLEAAICLNLAHSGLDALLARGDEDLLERKQATTAQVPDEVDEREAALS